MKINNFTPAIILGGSLSALGTSRCLWRGKVPTYAVCRRKELLAHSRTYRSLPGSDPDHCSPTGLPDTLEACGLTGAVLFPCADDWLSAVSTLPMSLRARFPAVTPPEGIVDIVTDKWQFARQLQLLGVPHPQTIRINSLPELCSLDERCFVGRFLKPCDSLSFARRHGKKAHLFGTKAEAISILKPTAAKDLPMLLQETIPGPPQNTIYLEGVANGKAEPLALFARRRLRIYPPRVGNSTYMESISVAETGNALSSLRAILDALHYEGLFSAEFKYDDRDSTFKIIEINARSWWYVEFASRCGLDLCVAAYLTALGQKVPPASEYALGKHFVHRGQDWRAFCATTSWPNVFKWWRACSGSFDSTFSWLDPGPGAHYVAQVIAHRAKGR